MSEHIGIFLPNLGVGGIQRAMALIAGELARRQHRVDVVVSRSNGLLGELVPPEVRVIELHRKRMATAVGPLASYLKRSQPSVLLSTVCNANIAALFARRIARTDTRMILSEVTAPATQRLYSPDDHRLERIYKLIPHVYPWANGIVALSEGVAHELSEHFRIARATIDVIPNPVSFEEIERLARAPLNHPWLRPGEPPVVLGVGRFVHQKDFGTLLTAFAVLRRTEAARLVLLGDGPLRSQLERQVLKLGIAKDVSMPGFVVNPFAWMRRARVMAQSSLWEGFGNTIAEALVCGTRVVATDCPHGPSEILDGGRYGRLVPPGDPIKLAAALSAELHVGSQPEFLIQRAREFSVESVTDRYEEILLGATEARVDG